MTLRELYNRYLRTPLFDRVLRALFRRAVGLLAFAAGFSFPNNYFRRQRWEMLTGRYEQESVALFKRVLKSGMVVVDIGAHIGYFTRLFSKLVGKEGKVLAFEADPFIFALLQKNIRRFPNVAARQLAVSDQSGTMDFYHSEAKSGCGSLVPELPVSFKKTKLQVPGGALDSLLENAGIEHVDLIKMDIEGGEPHALLGMRKMLARNPDIILVTEFAPEWLRAGGMEPLQFLAELKHFGFNVFAVVTDALISFDPKTEAEMRAAMPSYFMNLYCKREGREKPYF